MPNIRTAEQIPPASCDVGKVSVRTLEKWALIRQIAELEEALSDTFHRADLETVYLWTEAARRDLAQKRAALRAL